MKYPNTENMKLNSSILAQMILSSSAMSPFGPGDDRARPPPGFIPGSSGPPTPKPPQAFQTQRPMIPQYSSTVEYMLNPVTKPTPKPILENSQPSQPIRDSESGPSSSAQKVTQVDGKFCNRQTPCGANTLCQYEEGFKGTCTPCLDMTKANHCRSWKIENQIHRNGFKDCMHKEGLISDCI